MIKKICRKRKKSYMGDDEMVRKLKSKKVFDGLLFFPKGHAYMFIFCPYGKADGKI